MTKSLTSWDNAKRDGRKMTMVTAYDAIAAEARAEAGARIVLMEAIPAALATEITACLPVPTIGIGIGAGPGTDGQVLVLHDILGLSLDKTPSFAKVYLNGAELFTTALASYARDVRNGSFPA